MTRGVVIGVFSDKILESVEFNGDMSPFSRGSFLMDMLEGCSNEGAFIKTIQRFDHRFFHYAEYGIQPLVDSYELKSLNFQENNHGYPDYIYLFNFSGKEISVIDKSGTEYFVPNGEACLFYYCYYKMSVKESRHREDLEISKNQF